MNILKSAACAIAFIPALIAVGASAGELSVESRYKAEIRTEPVAGVYNKAWYNYRTDIAEADKELTSDLRRATDREDTNDAWDEFYAEIVDADKDYVKAMRKQGYQVGRVTLLARVF